MAKRSFRGKPKKAKGANPSGLMAQFEEMQQQMATQQEELAHETVSITAGGGAITVVITGHQRVQSIEIQPELIDPEGGPGGELPVHVDLLVRLELVFALRER